MLRFIIGLVLCVHCAGLVTAQDFVHPGLMHTQTDLDRMRDRVAAKDYPWYGGFLLFKTDQYSQSDYILTGPEVNVDESRSIRFDSTAAYQNAIMWYITGDDAHRDKAIEIINAWSSTLETISFQISGYIAALKFAAAGEILRHNNSGWSAADIARCEGMLNGPILDILNDGLYGFTSGIVGDGNQGAGNIRGMMAIAIFCDDRQLYDLAVNEYKGAGDVPCVAMDFYIDANGCPGEAGRDSGHPQGGINSYLDMAQMALSQGDLSLFTFRDNRLRAGVEWTAAWNLGHSPTYSNRGTCFTTYGDSPSSIGRGVFTQMYEMSLGFYGSAGTEFTSEAIGRLRPENGAIDDPGYGSLLFARRPDETGIVYDGVYTITAVHSGKTLGIINSSTSLGADLEQRTYSGLASQQWRFVPLGGNYYQIWNNNTGSDFFLDSGSNPAREGVVVHQWVPGPDDNKIWLIEDAGNGQVKLISRDTVNMEFPIVELLLEVENNSTADGALVVMGEDTGDSSEQFTLTRVAGTDGMLEPQLESGLVGYWPFENSLAETSGLHLPGTHDGTSVGSVTYTDGPTEDFGSAIRLTGSSGVRVNNSRFGEAGYLDTFDAAIDAAEGLTISFWASGFPGRWAPFVAKRGENGTGYQMRRRDRDGIATFTLRGTDGLDDPPGFFDIASDQPRWIHYVGTWNGSERRLFINGQLDSNMNQFNDFPATDTGPGNAADYWLTFGMRHNSVDATTFESFLTGSIDDVAIWNRALNVSEVVELFNNPLSSEVSILGDVNGDGAVDLLDVAPFVDLILNGGFSEAADFNGDQVVDLLDVAPFIELILNS